MIPTALSVRPSFNRWKGLTPRRWKSPGSGFIKHSRAVPIADLSLISQRLDRIQIRGFECGVSAEDDTDDRADHQADDDPIAGNGRRAMHQQGGDVAAQDAEDHADRPTHFAQHNRFHDELSHDVPLPRAYSAADADLASTLGHRDEHDVH